MTHMKRLLSAFAIALLSAVNTDAETTTPLPIIPAPASLAIGEGHCHLSGKVSLVVPANRPGFQAIADLFCESVKPLTTLGFEVSEERPATNAIVLTDDPGQKADGYTLTIGADSVEIASSTDAGMFYGLQSLSHLLPLDVNEADLPCLTINDAPRFPWRGVMLDCSRHFFSKEDIKKLLDTMARYKLNRFHWHLVDDQGWRLEIKKYPQLTSEGATKNGRKTRASGFYYTQEDVREIVAYAEARFITVVPEIEMPGHSLAILSVLPELKCDPDAKGWVNVFCAGNDKTYEVLRDILEETFALFPSEFVHIGGDEANKTSWKSCPKCQARMKREGLRSVHALQSYFIKQMEPVFHKHGKRLLGWDEIMDGGLAPSAAVMYWRSQGAHGGVNERVAEAARKGHTIIMTPQTYCYYDFPQDENWFNEPAGWKGAVTTRKTYAFEPIPEGLPADKQRNILGAQCNLWSERVPDVTHAEYMLFPRVFALAEVMWSPKSTRDYDFLMQRSLAHLPRLAKRSVNVRYPDGIAFETRNGLTSITPELPGAVVRYTTDGSAPSAQSPVYQGPFKVNGPTLVKAAIVKQDGSTGRVKSHLVADSIDTSKATAVLKTPAEVPTPMKEVLDGSNWRAWGSDRTRKPPFPHDLVIDLKNVETLRGFVYEPRADDSTIGNILAYELLVSDGTNESVAAKGKFSGEREQQFVIFPEPAEGRLVTLRVLDAIDGVTTGSEVRLFR